MATRPKEKNRVLARTRFSILGLDKVLFGFLPRKDDLTYTLRKLSRAVESNLSSAHGAGACINLPIRDWVR
jgi:hypothetical protein